MKFDLKTPLSRLDGEEVSKECSTLRGALLLALDSQPTVGEGINRVARPATIAEVKTRLAIESKFPPADASEQIVDLDADEVTELQNLSLHALPLAVSKSIIKAFAKPLAD